MNDLKSRLKGLSDNKKRMLLIAFGVLSLIVLVLLESGDSGKESSVSHENVAIPDEYIEKTENQLKAILSRVEGAGAVSVMITLESCYENVYAHDYNSNSESQVDSTRSDITEELVVVENSEGESGVVIKVNEPVIKGVAVVAEGADNIKVKSAITEIVCALFDISSAKVSVTKGKSDKER